jgi:hypothetical protein
MEEITSQRREHSHERNLNTLASLESIPFRWVAQLSAEIGTFGAIYY